MSTTERQQWSRGDLHSLGACPACSSQSSREIFERKDDTGRMPDLWRMHVCASCKSIYLDPRPDETSLPAAYDDYLTHETPSSEAALTDSGLLWGLVRDYLSWRFGLKTSSARRGGRLLLSLVEPVRLKLDRFGRHLFHRTFPNGGRLLDVGCGNGEFLLLAQAMGWHAEGVEPDPKAAAICRSRNLQIIQGGIEALEDRQSEYDVITLNQVIEHVIDPREVLARSHRLLKPGGMIWLGLPNPRAIGVHVFGAGWCGLHPPFHLWLPSQPVLRKLLKEAGFERVRFMRRGWHARAHFRDSPFISEAEGLRQPSRSVRAGLRIFDDLLATLTARWAEETVAIAWRSAND